MTRHKDDERAFAPNATQGRQEVGRGNPDAGPVESPNFYGTGTDDLRAGSGKVEQAGEGLVSTDRPRGPTSGPRDAHGGQTELGPDGIPVHDSRAD